jgi:hypothetical protein
MKHVAEIPQYHEVVENTRLGEAIDVALVVAFWMNVGLAVEALASAEFVAFAINGLVACMIAAFVTFMRRVMYEQKLWLDSLDSR